MKLSTSFLSSTLPGAVPVAGRWKQRKHVGEGLARNHAIARDQLLSLRDLRLRGHQQAEVRGDSLALSFVRAKEESLVFDDRSAQRRAELVVAESALGIRIAVKKISRVHGVVAQEFESRTVKMIRPRLGDDVDHRAAVASVFGAELRLQVEFLDRVNRQNRSRSSADAGLVESGIVEKRIVVVGAVERVVVGAVAAAVNRELSKSALDRGHARRLHRRAWHQRHQLSEIASVQRQIRHQLLVHNLAQHIARAVDKRTLFCDRDLLLPSFHLRQIEVRSGIQADIHHDILCYRVQVRSLRHDHIPAGGQFRQHIAAVGAGE